MSQVSRRFWFTFPNASLGGSPVLWRMSRAYPDVIFDIRQSTVRDESGVMAIQLTSKPEEIDAALEFVRDAGLIVEPIEKSVVEG